ncbi:MAG: amino acid ABC transporter substrate-binding protein [Lachnospiraceae bacterium]|nr:amino acid ABC transporter substrate-binding protein [Lachnospiraceae bacterium]
MKKLIAIIMSALMILSLAACGDEAETTAAPESTEAQNQEAETDAPESQEAAEFTTVQPGKLIMGTNASFPPYEYTDDGNNIIGIDAEIAALIAQELGLELEIQDMEFGSIITAVQTGKIDIGLAGMTVTEDRLQNVNFSSSYAKGVQVIIVPEGSEIKTVDDLAGKKIGVQESTTGHIYCEDEFGADNVVAYPNGTQAVQALVSGKVDCVVIDNNPAKAFVEANEGLTILETAYADEDYAAAISKDNEALLAAFNAVLDAKIADGTIQGIIDKYIPTEN